VNKVWVRRIEAGDSIVQLDGVTPWWANGVDVRLLMMQGHTTGKLHSLCLAFHKDKDVYLPKAGDVFVWKLSGGAMITSGRHRRVTVRAYHEMSFRHSIYPTMGMEEALERLRQGGYTPVPITADFLDRLEARVRERGGA
jgi:hypothetical protein